MKLGMVGLLSLAGMMAASGAVYGVTAVGAPDSSWVVQARPVRAGISRTAGLPVAPAEPPGAAQAHFSGGTNLRLEGRLAHAELARNQLTDTHMLLEVSGGEAGTEQRAPVDMALVLDRSGSMQGSRRERAIEAAVGVVSHLHDGDRVSVVTFDTTTETIVPLTRLSAASRPEILSAIRALELGGDTCISCGIETALGQLPRVTERVQRMIVLSDGLANHGVRHLGGFSELAKRAQARDVAVSTVGVGVDYNERILSTVAFESNGRHYFAEDASSLAAIFQAETTATASTVASGVHALIRLAAGVELLQVVDRDFHLDGGTVVVPLGTLAPREIKTVLVKLRVKAPPQGAAQPVAQVTVRYRDVARQDDAAIRSGRLIAALGAASSDAIDPVIAMRLLRTGTGDALQGANALFSRGQTVQAQEKLSDHIDRLERERTRIAEAAPDDLAAQTAAEDLGRQQRKAEKALSQLKQKGQRPPPAPTSTAGRAWVLSNEADALTERL